MDEELKLKSNSIDFQFQSQVSNHNLGKSLVWDCGSSLYDSFELQSLKRQLNSAITASSRSFSMPHLSDRRAPPPPTAAETADSGRKSSRLSRSFRKLLRSVFRPSKRSSGSVSRFESKTGYLKTIPEVSGFNCGVIPPAINSFARKASSARFSDISCT